MQGRAQTEFDVLVIGSGASGGWAAKRLTEAGIKVALIEAGRAHRDNEFMEHQPRFELPFNNLSRELLRKERPRQADCYACTEFNSQNIEPFAVPDRVPGYGIHELGVARMGDNPKTSVLNQFQQTHDIDNLFVMDGASFASGACQNPTLTIMTLAVRSTDHLMEEMSRGNL